MKAVLEYIKCSVAVYFIIKLLKKTNYIEYLERNDFILKK